MSASGTKDKAGSIFNLIRWVNAQTIKETLNPPVVQGPYRGDIPPSGWTPARPVIPPIGAEGRKVGGWCGRSCSRS
ncbi:hypothetical protein Aple_007910 [Acrocarpospora pleiomorpha]|uniref:Uncharacterized protein n=1 Tax=Acrocarpospora pleiomorpha TaxID=90975 RepID=A0A5M3XB82_9ACTN|nr:hypothetical protein Aple_007910 [Acrocarpospora pleiomorpha]